MYDTYRVLLAIFDQQIALRLMRFCQQTPIPSEPLPKTCHWTRQPNALNFDARTLLYQLVSVDLAQIHILAPYLELRLVPESGTDLSRWRTAQHFTS